jgi:hypothetical protein
MRMALRLRSASTIGSTCAATEARIRQDATGERLVQLQRNAREREREARTRTWSDQPDGRRGGGLGGDDDETVQVRLAGREEVLQRPLQRVVAVVALVHPHQHGHLPRRGRRSLRRHGATGSLLSSSLGHALVVLRRELLEIARN